MLVEYTKNDESKIFSVIKKKNKYFCLRCGNNIQNEFFKDQLGTYCRRCLIFGKSSTYKKIWRKQIFIEKNQEYCLKKEINLSELQKKASNRCVEAFKRNRDMLIYAVCGAGKTEIVYEVILKALNDAKIVCFATPRKDVVLELIPRFKRDFLHISIVGLYANSPDKGKIGNLYISTTHQLINYYQFFDLVIIDEVDAFPFYNNEMLEGFIKKAKKENAPIIYLTATPPKRFFYLMKKNIIDYFIIPVRFHKYPIPIPRVVLTSNTVDKIMKGKCPQKIYQYLSSRDQSKRVFIFVPSIIIGQMLEKILRKKFSCKFVHAEMKDRKKIISDFRNNKIKYIITTTILERGVTVSNVDVCIIKCDDRIFDDRAIIQIVGRSGRDKLFPSSDVVLFADFYTLSIKKAIKQLKKMNKLAKKMKLLR